MAITKDLTLKEAHKIIDESEYATMSVFDFSIHSIPFSFARSGDYIYFASAKKGTKVEIFEREQMIKLVFVSKVKTADKYSDEKITKEIETGNISFLNKNVFTNEYESAIADGLLELLSDNDERKKALEILYSKYYSDKMKWFNLIEEKLLQNSHIYKVQLTNITAKGKYL